MAMKFQKFCKVKFTVLQFFSIFRTMIRNRVRKIPSTQQKKRRFRDSKRWKDFREHMKEIQGGLCQVTGAKLTRLWQLHHLDLDEENYQNLIEDNFVCLSWNMHKVVHALFVKSKPKEWRKRILKLIIILKRMEQLNSK